MRSGDNSRPAKKPVNLSVNSDLLAAARELRINLSATMEAALAEAIKGKRRDRWLADNRAAIRLAGQINQRDGYGRETGRTFCGTAVTPALYVTVAASVVVTSKYSMPLFAFSV